MTGTRRHRTVWRALAVAGVVLGIVAAAAAATGFGFNAGSAREPGSNRQNLPPATGTVTRQTLIDAQTEHGELGHGDSTVVIGRLAGTITGLPEIGATLQRGDVLYRVDNTPVVLMYGSLPQYRVLAPGTEGPDVSQFERNLADLGYTGVTVDDKYTDATAAAVKRWQKKLGLAQTGVVELGRVYFAPGQVRVDSHSAAVGTGAQPEGQVLAFTGTVRVITVEMDVDDVRLARKDAPVTVKLPDGKTVNGKIVKAATVVKPAEGQNPATTTLRVIVAMDGADGEAALAGLDRAALEVSFTASKRDNVLTVPVAALLALAEGGYGVQVVQGDTSRIVAVRTGLFSGGRVEVAGDGLAEGMTVGMPS